MWLWAALLVCTVHGLHEDVPPSTADVSAVVNDIIEDSRCFEARSSACPPLGETCRCRKINAESAVCCHISSPFQIKEGLACAAVGGGATFQKLHIQNATLSDLDNLPKLHLESLSVSNSKLERLGTASHWATLQCLDLGTSSIVEAGPDSFLHLTGLQYLGLAGLNLTKLPRFKINVTLDLSGNDGLECSMLLQYLVDNPNIRFVHEETTFCSARKTFHWFNSTERVPLAQVQILRNIQEDCIPDCRCRSHGLDMVLGKVPKFAVHVDCSGLGLLTLPKFLPPNTISLNISNNNITSLDALSDDQNYQNIRELFADANLISSIVGLEGSKFIDNFLVLSLRDNKIKSLPTYILSNTFDRNYLTRTVNLGGNRFACNCSVAQVIKLWLLANKKHIPDYNQVFCENSADRVVELDVNKVCTYARDWTDYIYYIIGAEVFLFVLMISKVSYDYWVFKTAGYLPWPASKMPKLPCDWVFE